MILGSSSCLEYVQTGIKIAYNGFETPQKTVFNLTSV